MGSILEDYVKQYEEDKKNENYDLPEGCYMSDAQKEIYKEKLDALRNSEKEMMDKVKEFNKAFTPLTDKELKEQGKLTPVQVSLKVIKAYCPECGEEIVSQYPSAYDMFTLKKIARSECPKCHKRYNLENAYPRLAAFDMMGNEIKCFLE